MRHAKFQDHIRLLVLEKMFKGFTIYMDMAAISKLPHPQGMDPGVC